MLDDNERQCILNLAPAESKKPSGIFRYQYSEELAYLGIFLGRERPGLKERLMKVHYGDIYKSELGRSDRRPKTFLIVKKKIQMKILLGKSQITLRKCFGNDKSLKAGDLERDRGLQKLVRHDEGYKFLRAYFTR